jgi:hypothetical protein
MVDILQLCADGWQVLSVIARGLRGPRYLGISRSQPRRPVAEADPELIDKTGGQKACRINPSRFYLQTTPARMNRRAPNGLDRVAGGTTIGIRNHARLGETEYPLLNVCLVEAHGQWNRFAQILCSEGDICLESNGCLRSDHQEFLKMKFAQFLPRAGTQSPARGLE